jgi:serine/threonine protein kinase
MLLSQGFFLQDRYRIEMLLGRGGMGAVYKATDMRLGHAVAIKQNLFETADGTAPISHPTRPDDTEARRTQFEREARLLASLKHAGLAKVTDYFFIPGEGQYLVMDFIEGQDFGAVVSQLGALREEHAAGFISEIAQVLEYLHGQSPPIIHRDIKPANIRVTPAGQVFLVDFGVAKVGTGEKTMFGAQAVTPGFSPLEQFGGDKPTDERADVYSLAATLYALTVGRQPPSAIDILRGRPLFDVNAPTGLRPALIDVIARGMALEPEDRYPTMTAFREALLHVFPDRTRQAQRTDTVNLVTQIYTQPMASPGSEMGVYQPTDRPGTRPPAPGTTPSGAPPTGMPPSGAPPTAMPPSGAPPTAMPPVYTAPAGTTPPPIPPGPVTGHGAPAYAPLPSGPPPAGYPATAQPTSDPRGYAPPATGRPISEPIVIEREKKSALLPTLIWAGVALVALFFSRDLISQFLNGRKADDRAAATPTSTSTPNTTPATSPGGNTGATNSGAANTDGNTGVTTGGASVTPAGGTGTGTTAGSMTTTGGSGTTTSNPASGPTSAANDANSRPITPGAGRPPGSPSGSTPAAGHTPSGPTSGGSGSISPPPPVPPAQPIQPPAATPQTPSSTTPSGGSTSPGGSTTPAVPLGSQIVVSSGGDGQFTTLEAALQAHYDSGAKEKRTIVMRSGNYRLPPDLVLHTPIEIQGQGTVVLTGTGTTTAIRVRQPGITLNGLTINSSGQYGVLVVGQGSVDIRNCTITDNREAALALTESARATGLNVTLTGANFGVITDGSSNVTLTGATISGNGVGAQARAGSTIRLTGGTVARSRQSGLLVVTGGTIVASGITLDNNGLHGAAARSGKISLSGATVSNNAQFGLYCESASGVIEKIGVTFVGNKMGDTSGCP